MIAARAEATLGEICNAFKPMWGEYREPARFWWLPTTNATGSITPEVLTP